MEFERLQFNARKAFFKVASDITLIIEDNDDKTYNLDIIGGGKNTISSNIMKHNVNLSDKEIQSLANSIEGVIQYKEKEIK